MKDYELQEHNRLLALSKIYNSLHVVNLRDNTFEEFSATREIHDFIGDVKEATSQMRITIQEFCTEECKEEAVEFTDLTTVADRLAGKKIISRELISRYNGWFRASFIPIETDENGKPISVFFVTQVIEDEKRQNQLLAYRANTDMLTGFLNRYSYEEEMTLLYHSVAQDFIYISFDVNGLKAANDSFGHQAGDELLKGAAYCIAEAFSEYGHLFRIGGDEFVAIITKDLDRIDEFQKEFMEYLDNWHGNLIKSLSISCGFVRRSSNPKKTMHELAILADKKMYECKANYYKQKGIDRRL